METFRIDLGRSWFVRLLGRHPLVRTSDRIEALVFAVAAVAVVLAVPIVAAMGTALHDSRSRMYTEQEQHAHSAVATALADSETTVYANAVDFSVQVRWKTFGSNHVGVTRVTDWVHAGDHVDIWVDERGDQVAAPTPPSRAGQEALGAAVLMWTVVASVAATFVVLSRRRLNRVRYDEWDRELRTLAGGGRFTSEP